MAELSVEEAQSLARQFLTGKAGADEIARLRAALENDQTAALELLAQMQTALEDVAPSGLTLEQGAAVQERLEALIVPRIKRRGLKGIIQRLFGAKRKRPALSASVTAPASAAPAPTAPTAPPPPPPAAASPPPPPASAKVSAPPAIPPPALGVPAPDADLEETAPIGRVNAPPLAGGGEDEVMPGPPPLKGLAAAAGGAKPGGPQPLQESDLDRLFADVPKTGGPKLGPPGAGGAEAPKPLTPPLPATRSEAASAAVPVAVPVPAPAAPPARSGPVESIPPPAPRLLPRVAALVGILIVLAGGAYLGVQNGLLTLPALSRLAALWKKPAPPPPPPPPPPAAPTPVPGPKAIQRGDLAAPLQNEPLPAEIPAATPMAAGSLPR